MKLLSMGWAISALLAICMTPGLSNLTQANLKRHQPPALAQGEPPVALPGSADAPGPLDNDDGYQAGQGGNPDDPDGINGGNQAQDNPDAAQQPQTNMQPPADENDPSSQQQPEQEGGEQAPPTSSDDN